MSTPRISPSFRREKGSPSPCLGALLDPSCQETIPSACSDKLIPENVFFSLLSLFPPPAIMSFPFLTRSHPSFLPPYKPWVMNEVLKIKTWMQDSSSLLVCHHLSCKADKASAYILLLVGSVTPQLVADTISRPDVCYGRTSDCLCVGIHELCK